MCYYPTHHKSFSGYDIGWYVYHEKTTRIGIIKHVYNDGRFAYLVQFGTSPPEKVKHKDLLSATWKEVKERLA